MATGRRLNHQITSPKAAPYCERLPSHRLRAIEAVSAGKRAGLYSPKNAVSNLCGRRSDSTTNRMRASESRAGNKLQFHIAGSVVGIVPERHVDSAPRLVPNRHTSCGATPQAPRLRANGSRQRKHCQPCGDNTARFFFAFCADFSDFERHE